MSNFYEQLCESFIKPSRQSYHRHDLGKPSTLHGRRTDFEIKNKRNLKLVCSFYQNNADSLAPCVLYLHGFNGSRLESMVYVDRVLATGLNMCAFDFAGTGVSEGEYVSLGAHEQFDILDVIRQVIKKFNVKKYILWGRSMGAAAAIKFASLVYSKKVNPKQNIDFEVLSLILDSPFYSLAELSMEIAKSKVRIPQILIKAVLLMVKSTIESKANFDMNELELLPDASIIKCPVLLIASKDDKLIHYSHADKIYKAILHRDKQILFIKGEHYDVREDKVIKYILEFISSSVHLGRKLTKKSNLSQSSKIFKYGASTAKKQESQGQPLLTNNSSLGKVSFTNYSAENGCPTQAKERLKTSGSLSQSQFKLNVKEIEEGNRNKNVPVDMSQKSGEYEQVCNNYKKPYFNLQTTGQFATPSKQKLRKKKHVQSQQILDTKQFFSDKKIRQEDRQQTKETQFREKIAVDIRKVRQANFKSDEINPISQKVQRWAQLENSRSKERQKQRQRKLTNNQPIRVLNKNIRILNHSVQFHGFGDHNRAENSLPKQYRDDPRISDEIEVNHLNVINSKLKRNRHKKLSNHEHVRQIIRENSVSLQRKWMLNVKKPPNIQGKLKVSNGPSQKDQRKYLMNNEGPNN